MDTQSYSRLLNYAICEMSMPVKRHIYNFALDDQVSMNPLILSAAAQVAKRQHTKANNMKKPPRLLTKTVLQSRPTLKTASGRSNGSNTQECIELYNGIELEKEVLEYDSNSDQSNEENACENYGITDVTISRGMVSPISNAVVNKLIDRAVGDEINSNTNPQFKGKTDNSVLKTENVYAQSKNQNGLNHNECIVIEDEKIPIENPGSVKDISDLYSDPLLLCSDTDFKSMFRLTRSTFQILVDLLSKEEMEPIEDVPLYKKTLIVLWLLGNSGSYSDAAQVFGVSEEAAANCFFDVCATLYNLSDNFIRWPDSSECNEIASRIEADYGFQGTVGVLGCHYFSILIPKEALSRREHFNANLRTYCISLQIVCDDKLVIRDIFPGLPGGIPPVQALRDSPLCEQLTSNPHALVDPNKHILARSEYPQLPSMLTPYVKPPPAYLNKEELEFNSLHESVCLLVDQTFQMLQDRFSTLKLLDPEVATMVLVTTCVLHNICVQNCDLFESEEKQEDGFTSMSTSA